MSATSEKEITALNLLTLPQIRLLESIVDDGQRPPGGRVWQLDQYAIATDGHCLLALEGGMLEKASLEDAPDGVTAAEAIRSWLSMQTALGLHVSMSCLLEWLRAEAFLRCPCCDGSGRRDIGVTEKFVEGEWMDAFKDARPEIANGFILGTPVWRDLMVETLAYLPMGGDVELSLLPEMPGQKGRMVRIVGNGWRYVQMSLDPASCGDTAAWSELGKGVAS